MNKSKCLKYGAEKKKLIQNNNTPVTDAEVLKGLINSKLHAVLQNCSIKTSTYLMSEKCNACNCNTKFCHLYCQ